MRTRTSSYALIFFLVLVLALAGCSSKPKQPERRFPIEGTVVSIDKPHHQVTLKHKDIPGFMKAMTMPFKVRDQWALEILEPGDYVNATLVVNDEGELESIAINKDRHKAEASSTSAVRMPSPGEVVPDFHFVDQNGRKVSIAHFRGNPLLVTFVYTRCPLPDFCIRMSNNFVEVAKTLKQQNPAAYAKLQMLSISIDPEYDKPAVLKQYAMNYMGNTDPKLEHWTLVSGTPEETRKAAQFFGLTYLKDDLQIVHDLRTAIIAPDGKLVELYEGNEWKPADVAAKMASLQK
ncbi:MAG TPA: SCO family protein [Candidatus Acidoferrales bacterium]|nr:SCO family protein [Candidatus Acidoferrales bacterium]